jgi:hypothetical protein
MVTKEDLKSWVVEALRAHGGSARVVQVSEHVWHTHEEELQKSGRLLYTWQYDIRWAAHQLRKSGEMKPAKGHGPWELA